MFSCQWWSARVAISCLLISSALNPRCLAINIEGFEITQSPSSDVISLATETPFILSFTVCGTRQSFKDIHLAIKVSQDGIGGTNIIPNANSLQVRDSDAEIHGVAASVSNLSSPDYELCNKVLVLVWPNHDRVQNSSVGLLLLSTESRFPLVLSAGTFYLYSPDAQTTSTPLSPTPIIVTPAISASESPQTTSPPPASTPLASSASITTTQSTETPVPSTTNSSAVRNIDSELDSTTPSVFSKHDASTANNIIANTAHLAIDAVLAALLLTAIVIIIVLVAVIKHQRQRKNGDHGC